MFTLGDVPDWRPVRLGLWLSQIGLLGLVPALLWRAGFLVSVFAVIVLAGMLVSLRALQQTLATRKKRILDRGLRAFVGGVGALTAAAVLGCLLASPSWPWGSAPGGAGAMVYALLIFFGGLLPVFTGMMCKIVPFLTWMQAYGPKVGRSPTPVAGAMTYPRIERWGFVLQTTAVAPLIAGAWMLNTALLSLGTILLAAGIALFLANMAGVLRHLWHPAPAKSFAVSPTTR
jgi:hypothetical protein